MSQRYQRVDTRDDDDESDTPVTSPAPQTNRVPNSPPPSFHSRASSITTRGQARGTVDPALADAFDTAGDDSDGGDDGDDGDDDDDDEADDRQRLVRDTSPRLPQRRQPPQAAPMAAGSSATAAATSSSSSSSSSAMPPLHAGSSTRSSRVYGSGIQSDGVFSNMTAKPERGDPEKEEQPPSYEQAAADAAPPYWETTILAPGVGGPDEVYIDGMPVGSLFSFLWNGMISASFQLVGFLLTYLLHSTHAAKNGSRAGLGITLIRFGFLMKGGPPRGGPDDGSDGGGMGMGGDGYSNPPDPNSHDFDPSAVSQGQGQDGGDGGGLASISSSDWIAYVLMIVGWFILIRALSDYVKARRHEKLVLQSPDRGLGIPVIAEGESSERVV